MIEPTPGPWKEVWEGSQEEKRGGWTIVGADDKPVMSAYVTETDASFTLPNAADRALILAAPEQQAKIDMLLGATKALLPRCACGKQAVWRRSFGDGDWLGCDECKAEYIQEFGTRFPRIVSEYERMPEVDDALAAIAKVEGGRR